jgi:ornithine carbamoyltransferase
MTLQEYFGDLKGRKTAFIGDGNNVARSLAFACAKLGMKFVCASPAGYELDKESIDMANSFGPNSVEQLRDPRQAVKNADCIYTDTWVSMGQESEQAQRRTAFHGYQVDMDMVKIAPKHVKIMHCLPAYRGFEITDEVCESAHSVIFDEAENRLHFQRALLKKLICG